MKHPLGLTLVLTALSAASVAAQVPAGVEFRVNTHTVDEQLNPALAFDDAGNFVVVWMSYGQDLSYYGIFGQRFDASGAPVGTEFRVNTYTTSSQAVPSVASDAAGDFVVVWDSAGQDGSGWGVFGRRYDATGGPLGPEFRVNTYTTADQRGGRVASDAAGNFVVVWGSYGQDGSSWGIYGQRYDASGTPRGSEFRVNPLTTFAQAGPSVASDPAGNFIVTWGGYSLVTYGDVFAQRFDASGTPLGAAFRVNTHTLDDQSSPSVATDAAGNFVIAWQSRNQDGDDYGIFAQRYVASGAARGAEFQVNTWTTHYQFFPTVASDRAGNFVVTWESRQDGSATAVVARRYDASGAPRAPEFVVNTWTWDYQYVGSVASDPAGNIVVAWSSWGQDGSLDGVFARRFGGLLPVALAVDAVAGAGSDGNSVLEPGETVDVKPSWANRNGADQTFDARVAFTGPPASGVSYSATDETGGYGTVADGATAQCTDCYEVQVGFGGTRPATHWDTVLTETITPDALGEAKPWKVHVGESFSDVPRTSGFYPFVERLLHNGVTGGCGPATYCPASSQTREQMAVFALVAKEGAGYLPSACTTPVFADVPASSPYCRWIEELARRGVVGGCGGGNYCPTAEVAREQMPVFMLRTLDPALNPPACGAPMFGDVPADSPYCRWIEELARRSVVTGCGNGNYCPADAVTREQMSVFISASFGLTLYGP